MRAAPRRGQPLLMLLALLGSWVGLRAALWEPPIASPLVRATRSAGFSPARRTGRALASARNPGAEAAPQPARPAVRLLTVALQAPITARRLVAGREPAPVEGLPFDVPLAFADAPAEPFRPAAAPFQPSPAPQGTPRGSRWSADAWLLLRRDTTTAVTSGRGSYGRSQVGAVLRYSLAPSGAFRPVAYVRGSKALAGAAEAEVAAGLSLRPLRALPVSAAVEWRGTRTGGQVWSRPAAYAVSELPPFALPLGFRGEAYAQAGYVGGKGATAFADGQMRADARLLRVMGTELRGGGGVWGGAQKGASRLDLGPGASYAFDLGEARAKVTMDWRFRVAGKAEPASGPALTISAGF